jgi:tetratricopeptide (TPR) repeat protein
MIDSIPRVVRKYSFETSHCFNTSVAHVHLEQSEKEDAILCFEEYSRLLKLDNHRNLQDNAEICYTAGIISKLKGQLDNALAFYNQALAMFQALFGNQQHHEKIASIHFDIGCIYASKGDNKEALRQLHFCLATRKQLLGLHVNVATVLFEMALVLSKEGMSKPAIMCLEESSNIWQAKLGCSEKLVSVCHENGKLWKSLLKYDEAEGSYEKALELAITIHGQNHVSVATILLDLGELLHEIGEYDQALFCYDESLGAFTQLFGPEDPQVATVFYCKGVALLFQSRFDEALDCLERSLVIRQEKLGDLDNDVADTLNTIGVLHLRKGNIDGETAFGPLSKALEIRRSLQNKAKVVSTLQNLASLYKKRKEFDMCLEIHSEILAVRQEEFGMFPSSTLFTLFHTFFLQFRLLIQGQTTEWLPRHG